MSGETGHICVVCGTEIPDHHGRFVLPVGHVHQGCKAKMAASAAVSGEGGNFRLRRSSMLSCAPEAEALKYQWSKNFHPPDLALQRNEGPCAQGPSHQDAANYYKMNQSAPENAAHLYQWFGNFRPLDLQMQRNETCPQSPGRQEAADYYKTRQNAPDMAASANQWFGNFKSPSPGCESACPTPAPAPTSMGAEERIMRAQSQAWAGWHALRGGAVSGVFADGGTGIVTSKYMDAFQNCDPALDLSTVSYLTGSDPNGESRVAAMRAKIEAGTAHSQAVTTMAEVSFKTLYQIGTDLYSRYKDPTEREKLAKDFGVSVTALAAQIPVIDSLLREHGDDMASFFNELAKKIGPQIKEYLNKSMKKVSDSIGSTAESAGDMAAAANIYVAAIKMIYDLYTSDMAAREETNLRNCGLFVNREVSDRVKALVEFGLPYPWHIPMFDCGALVARYGHVAPEEVILAGNVLRFTFKSFLGSATGEGSMSVADLSPVKQWWSSSTMLMSNPLVRSTFDTMCMGDYGYLASDEQVMCVAVPIAIANGLDPWEFAAKLYDKCEGWGSRPDLFGQKIGRSSGNCGEDADTGVIYSCCPGPDREPGNVWTINWVVLTTKAYELVDEMKKEKEEATKDIFMMSPAYAKVLATEKEAEKKVAEEKAVKAARAPEILGGIATGILALAGVSFLLAATPLAIGLWLSRRKAQAVAAPPSPPPPSAPIPAEMFTLSSPVRDTMESKFGPLMLMR